jgi:hypothetical protein
MPEPIPLAYYATVVRRTLPRALLLAAAAALLAYAVVYRVGVVHEVYFSYLVAMSEREPSSEFRFDGYYALQATDLFATTLSSLLTAPETIQAAYEAAGLPLEERSARALGRTVSAQKMAAQVVQVVVRDADAQRAERLVHGLQRVAEQEVARYHQEGVPAVQFRVVATEPWMGESRWSVPVVVGVVFVFTLFLVLNTAVLTASLRHV